VTATQLDTPPTAGTDTSRDDSPRRSWWPVAALIAICLVSAVLYFWAIGDSWGNSYYSAAVKSMTANLNSGNLTNFFFGSFDPVGVVTVDKPPMALWVQVLSVEVFGFSKFAVLLPQALAGVAGVFLLHRTVRRWAGEHAALLAALVLALTPITVAINRDNNPDTLLVLLVVVAAYAMTRVVENGQRAGSWLLLASFLVGCGFVTKMLQAWMVLPAFLAAYLVGRRASWLRRLAELAGAGVMVIVSSFWWVAATALWPSPKPYFGGSTNGSALDLVFGYNGFGRIFGGAGNMGGARRGGGAAPVGGMAPVGGAAPGGAAPGGSGGGGGTFAGQAGLLRMFNDTLGGQISWLLPLSLLVLVSVLAVVVMRWRGGRLAEIGRRNAAGWVLWGGWLLTVGLMFSFAQGTMHPYYTTMLAPAVGAIVGAGICLFWHWYRRPRGRSWLLLPFAVAVTVVWAVALVLRNPTWNVWAGYVAAILGALAVCALLLARLSRRGPRFSPIVLTLGLIAILAVPSIWSVATAFASGSNPMGGANPTAGPSTGFGPPGMMRPGGNNAPAFARTRQGMRGGPGGGTLSAQQQAMVRYVQANAGSRSIPLAVEGGAMSASPYILNSDLTVIGMGGFTGSDNVPSIAQLTQWKQQGKLGFVLVGGGPDGAGGPPGQARTGRSGQPGGGTSSARSAWVQKSCTPVPPAAYGGDAQQLYDCR
jgi:4-amino-4-deoxy-L-arabinose transferase-like glycosyltransferase